VRHHASVRLRQQKPVRLPRLERGSCKSNISPDVGPLLHDTLDLAIKQEFSKFRVLRGSSLRYQVLNLPAKDF